jgi:hypothetical protein
MQIIFRIELAGRIDEISFEAESLPIRSESIEAWSLSNFNSFYMVWVGILFGFALSTLIYRRFNDGPNPLVSLQIEFPK